ncbi:unnamed protein product [Prorocentrum cordatum]|uniref:Protein S-acyltransferase n=1 Tax=Prorocentrum cordatum TaxID=2364126 RepID=A0ABN9WVC1_9DINO|nr:unnamed protein product [Polarella glacialis]
MWVRRCAPCLPAMLPSYAKILATTVSVFAAWATIRGMLRNVLVTDLDLKSPEGTVSCLRSGRRWPRIGEGGLWSYEGGEFAQWWAYDHNPEAVFGTVEMTVQECSTITVPLDGLADLSAGYPDPIHEKHQHPTFSRLAAAIVAYILSFLLAVWVACHDFALISYNCPICVSTRKAYEDNFDLTLAKERTRVSSHLQSILDVEGFKNTFPKFWRISQSIVACGCGANCCPCPGDGNIHRPRCIIAYVFSVIAFVTLVCPLVVLLGTLDYLCCIVFVCKRPLKERARLSRLVVFCLCCISSAMYLAISVDVFLYDFTRPT